ncbi:hypothetical protein SS50377_20149 [Spironucleus salmonicida]|uniref:Pre-rRNA-processing protein TSR2 n=1 Tax=Spironucleus salmonicida TaxID=348837 RepID=V6LWN9_9EUKA|nr:hypothetical protein SS50377_20149 [Spironucleus salmonicida]|eukprot:EST45204.1 Hypothetical protein SS50377_14776 [Spironucleus salmonicida]
MSFPQPIDVHGFLTKFPEDAPTEIFETSKAFKVSQFVVILKQLLSSWKVLKQLKGQLEFDTNVQECVSMLVKYFGDYADDASEAEVACYLETFMLDKFQVKLVEEQWEVALWAIETFYRMQAGDYSVNESLKNVIIYPFLEDKVQFKEKSHLVQKIDNIENQEDQQLIAECSDEALSQQCEPSQSQSSVSSYDDGIYEY